MRARLVISVALVGLMLVPAAGAQTFLTPGTSEVELQPGETTEIEFTIKNPLNRTLAGFARVDGPISSAASVQPDEFEVDPISQHTVTVTIASDVLPAGNHKGSLQVTLVDRDRGSTHQHVANLTAHLSAPLLLFNEFQPPLPEPFDNVLGLFILETAIWLAAGLVLVGATNLTIRGLTRTMPERFRGRLAERVDAPMFTLAVAGGLRYSWRLFPSSGFTGAVGSILTGIFVAAAAFLAYRAIDSSLLYYGERVAPRTQTRWDDIAVPVLRKVMVATVGGFVLLYLLQRLGLDLGFLVAGGVVIGLVLSSSLGPTLANLFSGLFILMDRPFREEDDIRLDTGEVCRVERIGLRSTRLYFYRNHEMIIAPNQQLENSRVVNLAYPDRRYRMHLPVSVAYGSPVDEVRQILLDVADEHPEVLGDEDSQPGVFFDDFGNDGLMFRVAFFVMEVGERFRIASEIRDAIDTRFREAGITIPFPQRTLWYGGTEELLERGREQAGEHDPTSSGDQPAGDGTSSD